MSTKVFKGRVCLGGKCEGLAEVSVKGFNTAANFADVLLGGKKTGVACDHDNEGVFGHDLAQKILCLPQTVGSSSAATAFLPILEMGVAPTAMLFANHIDSLAACGLLMADIWEGDRIICIDNLGDEFLDTVKCGDKVQVSDDGTVTISSSSSGVGIVKRRMRGKLDGSDIARNSLGGHVGADANYTLTSQTGSTPKREEISSTMDLTAEEKAMLNGDQGPIRAKCMKTIVKYGELFGSKKLVPLDAAPHLAMSWGSDVVESFLAIYRKLADDGLKSYAPFTANPQPVDYENLPMTERR